MGRLTTEDTPSIVVGDLYDRGHPRQEGPLVRGWRDYLHGVKIEFSIVAKEDELACTFRHTARGEELKSFHMTAPVTWASCNFGGRRASLHCTSCNRAVRRLYLDRSPVGLHCRACAGLRYRSQTQSAHERTAARAQVARERLGPVERFGDRFPPKPKGMHWRTYDRLCQKARFAEWVYIEEVQKNLAHVERHLADLEHRLGVTR